MRVSGQAGRYGAVVVVGLGAAEVLIMISPFMGFFYASLRFESVLGVLSASRWTAWLDGFFLNHAVVTDSLLLEGQRRVGVWLFVGGLAGFLISAFQVYGNKLLKRGVARGLLYRLVRHPQYLCLGIAGWGLLTMWPRFLLLGLWVTMLFLYAGLARFEEHRMEERFGEDYRRFAATRGAFLPGSPVRRLFVATMGRLRPRGLGWAAAYVVSLALAFSLGLVLRAHVRASAAVLFQPEQQAVVISSWPQPPAWLENVFQAAVSNDEVKQRLQQEQTGQPVVATILAPRYGMRGMYYQPDPSWTLHKERGPLLGVDPESSDEPVEVVFSRARKPYQEGLSLEEALDLGVRLTPLVVADVQPATGEVTAVRIPLPQNRYGPNVVMPLF
ncbi:MAG: hypothetical protein V3U28_03015 [Candidatus Acidoferrales bacterium]